MDAKYEPAGMIPALLSPDLSPLFWRPSRLGYDSAWTAHLPFAHWIVAATRPRLLVELGTHHGVSYAGFCEAVVQCGLDTRCYAVDTWQGDEHAGHYDESVYNDLRRFHEQRYAAFSEMLRCTFDAALEYMQDGSIDLLHIDGCHGYDAVRADFEHWLPKLSRRAVVLFHDTNVRERDFGVWRLFAELGQRYPAFEFLHEYGLGVVAVGPDAPAEVLAMCALRDTAQIGAVRERFAQLGERWRFEVHIRLLGEQVEAARKTLRDEQALLQQRALEAQRIGARAAQRAVEARRAASGAFADVDRLSRELEALRAEAARLDALSAAQSGELAALRTEAFALRNARAEAEQAQLAIRDAARLRLAIPKATDDRVRAEREVIRLRHQVELAILERNLWVESRFDLSVAHTGLQDAHDLLLHDRNRLQAEQAALQDAHRRLVERVAALQRRVPPPRVSPLRRLRHTLGLGLRFVWWTVSLRLPRALAMRARQRRELELLASSHLFDGRWYLEQYPDIAVAGLDPLVHYLRHGGREARNPGPLFDGAAYRAANPDIAAAGLNPLVHYLQHGAAEGRAILPVAGPPLQAAAPPPEPRPLPPRPELREPLLEGPDPVPDADINPLPLPLQLAPLRVVYFEGEPGTPGSAYRVARPAAAARRHGAWVETYPLAEAPDRRDAIVAADIVVIWRAAWCAEVVGIIDAARQSGAKLVFDVDDLMVEPDLASIHLIDGIRTQFIPESAVRGHYARVRDTMANCDFCIASTDELAWYMRGHAKTTFVLPNGFDTAVLHRARLAARRRRHTPGDGLFRIGYAAGSRTHQQDFAAAAPAVARTLQASPHARLVLFTSPVDGLPVVDIAEFPEFAGLEAQIEWRVLVPLEDLPGEMARFDVSLAPLQTGNPFCEAKSELKYFEAALADVVTIASPTGPFRRVITPGRTGFLADSEAAWFDALRRAIDEPALLRRMARAARRDVLWRFGPERQAEQMAAILDQIQGGPAMARAFALETARAAMQRRDPLVPPGEIVFEQDSFGHAEVTVIVPLYNYEHHVIEALDSVAAQTLAALHLVIVDDCSTDQSLSVALGWAKRNASRFGRIAVLRNTANAGLGPTRNAGFDAAETAYVLPLDADNRLRPACCERLLEAAQRSGAAFVYPLIREFGDSSKLMGSLPYAPQRLVGVPYIDAMALVSVAAWSAAGGYWDGRLGWEDYEFWCRLAELGLTGLQAGDEELADYRVHRGSMLQSVTEARQNKPLVMAQMHQLHPWLSIIYARQTAPAPVAAAHLGTLEALLPLLRCPVTGLPLLLDRQAGVLRSEDGTQSWPVIDGKPLLIPGAEAVPVLAAPHNPDKLPEAALALMREAAGPVLHLNGGGAVAPFGHAIEAGAALFPGTHLAADALHLPFASQSLAGIVALGGLEHYANPAAVAAEFYRVLQPGGRLLLRTALLQPAAQDLLRATAAGLQGWFAAFETEALHVAEGQGPAEALAQLTHAAEAALGRDLSPATAAAFALMPVGRLAALWTDHAARDGEPGWLALTALPQAAQQQLAAGYEAIFRRPAA